MGKVVGVFSVFFVGERGGFWNVAEGVAAKDVTIGFAAKVKIAVVCAGDGDLR